MAVMGIGSGGSPRPWVSHRGLHCGVACKTRVGNHSPEAYNAAVAATAEWIRSRPSSAAVLTEWSGRDDNDHDTAGPATGATERHEYLCPCCDGRIVEEHDHIPGFRDHDVHIDCDKCRVEWRFAEGRGVRDWALKPVSVSARS